MMKPNSKSFQHRFNSDTFQPPAEFCFRLRLDIVQATLMLGAKHVCLPAARVHFDIEGSADPKFTRRYRAILARAAQKLMSEMKWSNWRL